MPFTKKQDCELTLIDCVGKPQTSQSYFVGEQNLSINCKELRYLRRYLLLVGQWYPKEWNLSKPRRILYHIWQVCVTLGVWAYFVYALGCFGDSTLSHQYFKWFPINAIAQVVWNSRWLISHHIGLFYFCYTRHMETFLQDSCLNQTLWDETSRYLKRICLIVIVLVFIVPIFLRPVELSYSVEPAETKLIIMDTVLLAVDRLVTAPIFLVFVFEAYVLIRVVKGYGERIKIWPSDYKRVPGSGMRAAKQQFVKTNNLIDSVGHNLQLYLAQHFLLLLVTAFLGFFACAEQIETKLYQNHSYYEAEIPTYYKRINIAPLIRKPAIKVKMVANKSSQKHLQNLFEVWKANKPKQFLIKGATLGEDLATGHTEASNQQVLIEVGVEAILKILESIVLYMIPLTLMLRLQTKLAIVQKTILYSDIFDQLENGYLFQDEETVRIMAEFVSTCKGITIFGYKMPLFRAFLLSALAPFLTALTTFLFSYIHVKRNY